MSKMVELIFNRYQNLSDSEDEFTINQNIKKYKRNEEENNFDYNVVILHPHCNICNKFHKKESKCN